MVNQVSDRYGPVAVVFPGQGSQRVGMGSDLYNAFAEMRDIFGQASETLKIDMPRLCFSENELLSKTEFTQPAILTMEIAVYETLKKRFSLHAGFFAGHSLGEYTALVAADVIPFETALHITRKRGILMQKAAETSEGIMAALIGPEISFEEVEGTCLLNKCEVANYNSPEQLVISGSNVSVRRAAESLVSKSNSLRTVELPVKAPFHSRIMKGIEEEFRSFLNLHAHKFSLHNSRQVLSNYTGTFHRPSNLLDSLVGQVSGPVRWIQNMRELKKAAEFIYELGPQRVLSKFFSSIGVSVRCVSDHRSLEKAFYGSVANA